MSGYSNVDFFSHIDTEEKAYWLGFICADGNVSLKTNMVQIHLSQKDYKHLTKLGKVFGKTVYVGENFNKSKGKVQKYALLSLCNKEIKNNLLKCGVYPCKTLGDSTDVFNRVVPDNLINHFVRGYFDGDGSISTVTLKNGKQIHNFNIAGSHHFVRAIQNIIVSRIGLRNTKIHSQEGCDVIRWCGREQIVLIGQWMYRNASVYLERKKSRFDAIYKDIHNRGTSHFRGVSWHENNKKWLSSISHNKKRINLGYYTDENEAAMAYDSAIIKYNKPLYKLNFSRLGET